MNEELFRTCRICRETLSIESFHRGKGSRGGRLTQCAKCKNADATRRRVVNSGPGKVITDATILADIMSKFEIAPYVGCWIWRGGINSRGYAVKTIRGRVTLIHRYLWQLLNHKLPTKIFVCHKCDNPKCINPDHMFPGTPKENTADAIKKGRFNRRSKLSVEQVQQIRASYLPGRSDEETRQMAAAFGLSLSYFREVARGRRPKDNFIKPIMERGRELVLELQ